LGVQKWGGAFLARQKWGGAFKKKKKSDGSASGGSKNSLFYVLEQKLPNLDPK